MKKLSKLGLTAIALALSLSANAKGLLDGLVETVIDKVTENISKPSTTETFKTPYTSKCSYSNQLEKVDFEFDCIGERMGSLEIGIKIKEPIKFSSDSTETFTRFVARESINGGDWQIYGVGKNNQYSALHSFAYATGGGAGAPETLTFNNGDELILLTINMLNPLGE